ncbi:TrkH family potassium uptake protein [Lactococcus garvieae]|uniref:TrkH family potassium uptake protein n=1 Tax=Lactococcus garvieae TaxID=1363 RepID=A0AA43T788_9LACT|nr:TrkH family potassium uptake protein [Lactococcus garvieae]MDH7959406.1 TrkH family potassium uptake protein [Lactococcus garvieae]BDM76583.1 K+ transporter Trk [Lactococcus garvieae]BDW51851.1 K+ transporter Trk [Lactococcus garvieae]
MKNFFIKRTIKNLTDLQIIFLSFLFVVLLGGGILSLPISSKAGEYTSFVDSLFTAISATCVTGLAVLDTSTYWSFFGQVIILILIQVGGLGFMTLVASIFLLLNQKVSMKSRTAIQKTYSVSHLGFKKSLVLGILFISLIAEFIGAVLLSFIFIPEYGWLKGGWFSIFHSVSAYCNAGFDLFGNSLISYDHSPYIMLVISLLIVCGSLGFIVIMDLIGYKKRHKLSLHSKLALIVTGILILVGLLLFFITRFSFYKSDFLVYFVQSLFFAITPRTAGFAIQDYSSLSQASLFLTIILMTIGGTSGSTAGGIKTTTIGVFILNIRAVIRREKHTRFGNRTIPQNLVKQSYESIFLYFSLVIISTFLLLVLEPNLKLDQVLFEVVSALSTVGLSMNVTPELSSASKGLIGLLMFIGRVGIFTIIYSLNTKNREEALYKYPEENVMVG